MKILTVSIFGPHFFNWTEQLKDSGHEIYWLDVFDSNTKVQKIDFVEQIVGWRYKWDFPGRYFLKSKAPKITKFINTVNERKLNDVLEKKIKEIQPDVVHSFVMYLSAAPILQVMKKFSKIKWIYSSWGSDLYYYRKVEKEHTRMKEAFPRIDYMFADCDRDYILAVENGFTGKYLGKFPGGGGFDFNETDFLMHPFSNRRTIIIKGYQGLHGRCISVLEAISGLKEDLKEYKLVVFGANEEVKDFVLESGLKDWKNLEILEKITHSKVMELMGRAFIYIGNSLSDGTPNTLLEAIVMETFPIQSNPGGATAELIEDGKNGSLIENPENSDEIAGIIKKALQNPELLRSGIEYNTVHIKPKLERNYIKKQVLTKYKFVEENLNK